MGVDGMQCDSVQEKLATCSREKSWEERTIEDKLEVLREGFLHLAEMAHNTAQDVSYLNEHRHLKDGHLVVHISRASRSREFPYFVSRMIKRK